MKNIEYYSDILEDAILAIRSVANNTDSPRERQEKETLAGRLYELQLDLELELSDDD